MVSTFFDTVLMASARVSDVARGACLGAHWLRMLKAFIYMQDM